MNHWANHRGATLRNAVPYLRLYKGKVFVLKVGGEAFAERRAATSLLEQVAILKQLGIHVILVHGGGPQISELCERLDLDVQMEQGRRVTDGEVLDATTMVLRGTLSATIVSELRRQGSSAVGLSGLDGGLVCARRRERVTLDDGRSVDYGSVGDIVEFNTTLLETLLQANYLPVVNPLSADPEGALLNINADTVAAELAIAIGAEKLIFMTAAPGILEDAARSDSLVSCTDLAGLRDLKERGCLAGGMLPKGAAMGRALLEGVRRVHVISHQVPDSLLSEVFTNEGAGTLVVPDLAQLGQELSGVGR